MASLATTKPAIVPAPLQLSFAAVDPTPSDVLHLPQWQSLALQIQHNLEHQHHWTRLQVHTHSPLTSELLPRPLVSGLPPQRMYIHPDEQVELLKEADRKRKANMDAGEGDIGLQVKAEPELEWVLPTRLNEKWTLRRFAQVFDAIPAVPPSPDAAESESSDHPWRTTKRVLLGTVDSDSTVVYYFVHDGVVKPRQN